MRNDQHPFRDLIEAATAPGRPDNLGIILGGAFAGFIGALLHARGIALWLVPVMMAWLLGTAVVAIHLLRLIMRQRSEG